MYYYIKVHYVTSESKYSHFILTTSCGVPDLPDFWPMPEGAMPDQVTETEGADQRTLPPFARGQRSKAFCLYCSGGLL